MKIFWLLASAFVITTAFLMLAACSEESKEKGSSDPLSTTFNGEFQASQPITIIGYDGNAMEPFISRDGQYLFFNNLNDPAVNTNLHYATRINDITLQYQGEIQGVNSEELDAVASMDSSDQFYFTTTISYFDDFITIYTGSFENGVVTGIHPASQFLTENRVGSLNMDVEISVDGNTLYISKAEFSGGPVPDASNLSVATRTSGDFVICDNAEDIFRNVNSDSLEYAPAVSNDGLELFFTRANLKSTPPEVEIMSSKRSSVNDPFDIPQPIEAIQGELTEAPSITLDGRLLYYHKKVDGKFTIHIVER